MAALLLASAVLAGCTSGTGDPAPSDSLSAPSQASTTVSTPSVTSQPSTTPSGSPELSVEEQQAAADAEAAYRLATSEGFRHLVMAIREAAAQHPGVYVRTPELDAILQAVATDPDYNARANEPGVILQSAPTAADASGSPVVTKVRIDTIELYDSPRSVDNQDGITGVVTLTACVDATSVVLLGPDGVSLDPPAAEPRIQQETVTVRRQPQFVTGTVGWYVATRTGTEAATCDLP